MKGNRAGLSVVRYSLQDGAEYILIPPEENLSGATFLKTDKIIGVGRQGIAIYDDKGLFVKTVLPLEEISGMTYLGAGIAWLPKSGDVIVPFQEKHGGALLVHMRLDGTVVGKVPIKGKIVTSISAISPSK